MDYDLAVVVLYLQAVVPHTASYVVRAVLLQSFLLAMAASVLLSLEKV